VNTFAFIIHPIEPKRDVSRKYPLLGKIFNEKQINYLCTFFPPVYLSEVDEIVSATTGERTKGWLIACPLTAARMLELPERTVYRKIIQTGYLAERFGADILGLGAFTSVIGDGGITIANALDIPVTTGDAYTVSVALQATRRAARLMNIDLSQATAAVVGATGAIGSICAQVLATEVADLILIARSHDKLTSLKNELQEYSKANLMLSTDLDVLRNADVILTVSSATHAMIQTDHLKAGSVVCDVSRPRDVSRQVAAARDDVFVFDGGMVETPNLANFNFDFGFPPGMVYACMAETIALALEGRLEDYTLGKQITRQRVNEITAIAHRHGFRLSGFRSFERPLTEEEIDQIRKNALRR
jgi:fatty aldehyde-generating acyl-ACP reductase